MPGKAYIIRDQTIASYSYSFASEMAERRKDAFLIHFFSPQETAAAAAATEEPKIVPVLAKLLPDDGTVLVWSVDYLCNNAAAAAAAATLKEYI